jgi:hypothetical protein
MNEYDLESKLKKYKKTYLTKEVYKILWREKIRLRNNKINVSIQKLVNNSIIKIYGNETMREVRTKK